MSSSAQHLSHGTDHRAGLCPSHLNFYYSFPGCKPRQQEVPGPTQPQAVPCAASSGSGGACTDHPCSHPGEGPVLPSRAARGGHSSRGAARAHGQQGSGDRDGPRPKARWQEPLQAWGSALCLTPWPSAGQCCPHRLQAQRGGTHDVTQMTALWTPRHEVGSPSSILREIFLPS